MHWRRSMGLVLLGMALALGSLRALAQDPAAEPPFRELARLAVLPLKGEGEGHFGTPTDELTQMIVDKFLRTRRFDIMERHRLDQLLHETKFQNAGLVDDSSAARLGRLLGVKWVLVGSYKGELVSLYGGTHAETTLFSYFTGKLVLHLRMVNVESGKIQETFNAEGACRDGTVTKTMAGLMDACALNLERELTAKFTLRGYVLKVISEKEIMADLGHKDGLTVGDRFRIVAFTEDVVHPVTGKLIKGAPRIVAEAQVATVGEESCLLTLTSGKPADIKPGQALESGTR